MNVLTDELVNFDPAFNPNLISKSQMNKIPRIAEYLTIFDHFCLTDCILKYILCRKYSCLICARIWCGMRTPEIAVGDYNIRAEVLRWMGFPDNDPRDKNNLLPP